MAVRMGQDAIEFAKGQVTNPSQDWFRQCLVFVRRCFNVGPLFTSAEKGYFGTDLRHGTAGTPPLGVPVWWTNGGDGHVALSAGDGTCFSNDIKRHGKIDRVAISFITRTWGAKYRGWTEDVNGVHVWRPGSAPLPTVDLSNVQDAARRDQFRPAGQGLHEHDVLIVEKALRHQGVRPPQFVDGYAGTEFRKAYALFQKATVPPPFDGIPGRKSLEMLGKRNGFRVVT
jgi:hypothetical protein